MTTRAPAVLINMYFLADITNKVPIYVHFVEKLQTFDLRALGGSFCRKLGWGHFILFYDRDLLPLTIHGVLAGVLVGDQFYPTTFSFPDKICVKEVRNRHSIINVYCYDKRHQILQNVKL